MRRFSTCLTVLTVMASVNISSAAPVKADTWGCSYDKCLASCAKAGGQRCSLYCTKKLQEKQASKVCPAS
jgi:hypothetical protein